MSSKVEDILNKIEKNEINFDEANHFDFSSFTKEEILELKQRLDVYSLEKNTKQMALKIALNSLYGAQANQYFPLFNRDSAASITFMGRYLIQKTGENVEKFLEEKFGEYNYWVYGDTDSCYFSLNNIVSKVIEKKFNGKKWQEMSKEERETLIKSILKIVDSFIQPNVNKSVDETLKFCNSPQKGFMGAKVEKVNIAGIHVAKKRYALFTVWNEGTFLTDKPKLSVTGLEIVRSSTPQFCIEALEKSIQIIISEGEEAIQNYIKQVKEDFFKLCETNPEKVAKSSGVSSLDYYEYNGRLVKDGNNGTKIPCPINSRAAIVHNKAVQDFNLGEYYNEIVAGDKIKFLPLKEPNAVCSDIFGFVDEGILFDLGLIDSIDKEKAFETYFLQPLKLILDAVNFSIEKKSDINEWI